MDIEKINNRIIPPDFTLIEAMKLMDEIKTKVLFVFDKNRFVSILTLGDIQRALIKAIPTSEKVREILDCNKIFASVGDSIDSIRDKMNDIRAELMPILDEDGSLVDVLFWSDLFSNSQADYLEKIDLPVVIMAGGKGVRLKPITNVIPKPLIPVGEKTILEEIMDQFESIGSSRFFLSINFKADLVKYYLSMLDHRYNIEFFSENNPLGTIGSVALLKGKIDTPFFVSNCDIIVDQDFREVYDYHCANKNDITLVTAVKNFRIQYGVIETREDGLMSGLKEKPDFTYKVNTGVYILNPNLINEIPDNEFFNMTDLIEKVQARGGRVGCFPVSEHVLRDVGEWPEYLKMINVI